MFWSNFKKLHLIAGHRGNRHYFPENTLIAFKNAKKCDFIELDIQLTKDNEIVIIHDETPKRTSNFNTDKKISQLTLKELKEHNFGEWFLEKDPYKTKKFLTSKDIKEIKKQTIPTLKEALKVIKKPINIEIKSKEMDLEKLLFLIKGKENKILISSFHHNHLKNIKKLNPGIYTAPLDEIKRENILEYIKEFNTKNYNISKDIADKKYLKYLVKNNINVSVYTVNKKEKIKRYFKKGVKAVFRDYC